MKPIYSRSLIAIRSLPNVISYLGSGCLRPIPSHILGFLVDFSHSTYMIAAHEHGRILSLFLGFFLPPRSHQFLYFMKGQFLVIQSSNVWSRVSRSIGMVV